MKVRGEAAKTFKDLVVWEKSHEFVLETYRFTSSFPQREVYGLTSQMRRAALSIPANIAEGFKKKTKSDKTRFMNIAQGSVEESRYYLILSKDLGYGDSSKLIDLLEQVGRLLEAYTKSIAASVF